MGNRRIFGDFHIHIGRSARGAVVKVSGARHLTFANIVEEASRRKGMDMIGIIDAASPPVQREIAELLERQLLVEKEGGGLVYERTTVILGCELEIKPEKYGPAHLLCYFPFFKNIQWFSRFLAKHMKNIQLSTQRFHGTVDELFKQVGRLEGIIVPAHVFTPFKSLYGSCTERLADVLPPEQIVAVELGLSADTRMADQLGELHRYAFLSNSDAHSLAKIGREYNEMTVRDVSFAGWLEALKRERGTGIIANYGLDPRLGKYHRTLCRQCAHQFAPFSPVCPHCGSRRVVRGVKDRIRSLAHGSGNSPDSRPPYVYQIPLEFIPGIGPKVKEKLLSRFGTEMNIIHRVSSDELARTVGETLSRRIVQARRSELDIVDGGGGVYGKVKG